MRHTDEPTESRGRVTYRTMDLLVAAILMVVGAVVMKNSYDLGAGWSSNGPDSGYFPFYIGLLILASSTVTLLITLFTRKPDRTPFVEAQPFLRILQVLIPSIIFVLAIRLHRHLRGRRPVHRFLHVVAGQILSAQGRHGGRAGTAGPVPHVRSVVSRAPAQGSGRGVLRLLTGSERKSKTATPCSGCIRTTSRTVGRARTATVGRVPPLSSRRAVSMPHPRVIVPARRLQRDRGFVRSWPRHARPLAVPQTASTAPATMRRVSGRT